MPLTMAGMSFCLQKSTSRPWNFCTLTLGNSLVTVWRMSMRSSTVNRLLFSMLMSTATTTSSYSRAARAMMSRWPLVMGSNDPGQTTRRKTPPLHERSIPGGATVPNGRFTVTTDPLLNEAIRPHQGLPPAFPLKSHQSPRRQPAVVSQRLQDPSDLLVAHGVRRIGEHDVVRLRARLGQHPLHPVGHHPGAVQPERRHVRPDRPHRPRIGLHHQRV